MTSRLPKDDDGNTIPVMRPTGAAHKISASGTAAENSVAFAATTQVVSICSDVGFYYKLGLDDEVAATVNDHYLPAGVYYDIGIGGDKDAHYPYISVILATGTGTVWISEKQ